MRRILSIRPSNLVLLAAAPFFIYLFATSGKYARSLKAIIGVEAGALSLFQGFLFLLTLLLFGLFSTRHRLMGERTPAWLVRVSHLGLPVQLGGFALILVMPSLVAPYIHSVVANSVDPFTSDWVIKTVRPRQLVPEIAAAVDVAIRVGAIALGLWVLAYHYGATFIRPRRFRLWARVTECLWGFALLYLLFVAYWGFASGIAVTFRAAIFSYLLAAVLGLFWTGLQVLSVKKNTYALCAVVAVALLLLSGYFFLQPKSTYVLAGSTEARIAIVKGTPQSLADSIRFGEYEGASNDNQRIRSAPDVTTALKQIDTVKTVSGAFIPLADKPEHLPILWQVSFLPDQAKTPAITFLVLGFLLLVLTLGGWQHRVHPLAAGAEFFVDTIRGIPMLVIILYIGLPLSGALKDATDGGLDLSNMARGIVAIAVGYSAYMAEIFRSGIDAIPKGQIEASRSLGLSRWQTARLVILPQAIKVVIPTLGNEFIAIIKDTSLLSILSVRDVTQRMREFQASSFLPFAPFNTAAILYVVITLACASFLKWIERRYENKAH